MPVAVVLGARNLGGAVAGHLLAQGWSVAAVARSDASLQGLAPEIRGVRADASDPESLDGALAEATSNLGGLDLVVNAVSASRPPDGGGAFGGGPVAELTPEAFQGWGGAVAEQAATFLAAGTRALRAAGGGGTLVQVTGGSARRAMPGRGAWAAGTAGLRALAHAAAQELRGEGIHVALLIADGVIRSPKTADRTQGLELEAQLDQDELAAAVAYLAGQGPRGFTHELVITPSRDNWTP